MERHQMFVAQVGIVSLAFSNIYCNEQTANTTIGGTYCVLLQKVKVLPQCFSKCRLCIVDTFFDVYTQISILQIFPLYSPLW